MLSDERSTSSQEAQPDPPPESRTGSIDRRSVLRGACVVCVGVAGAGVLAACGGGSGGSGDSGSDGGSADTPIKTSDIPVGGGKVFDGPKVVVTQPTVGEFKAFTAVCTHQRFLVGNVQGGTINCLHHGSMFNMTTGAVVGGPAPAPLAAKTVTVTGDTLTVT
jgi:nitrite reductase/ring-hydroxylating ferredoxin subunit